MLRNLAIALLLLAFRALTLIILNPNMIRPDLIRDSQGTFDKNHGKQSGNFREWPMG